MCKPFFTFANPLEDMVMSRLFLSIMYYLQTDVACKKSILFKKLFATSSLIIITHRLEKLDTLLEKCESFLNFPVIAQVEILRCTHSYYFMLDQINLVC